MSHTLAARCDLCEWLDDPTCPECKTSSYKVHGVARQKPFRVVAPARVYVNPRTGTKHTDPGYTHAWHDDCPHWTDDMERRIQ